MTEIIRRHYCDGCNKEFKEFQLKISESGLWQGSRSDNTLRVIKHRYCGVCYYERISMRVSPKRQEL